MDGIFVYNNANTHVTGNIVSGNGGFGIYVLSGGDAQITGNTVSENKVGIGINVAVIDDNTYVNENNIFGNSDHVLNNTSGSLNPLNATNNRWGPGGTVGPGEDGNNDVSGSNVDFTPWANTRF